MYTAEYAWWGLMYRGHQGLEQGFNQRSYQDKEEQESGIETTEGVETNKITGIYIN